MLAACAVTRSNYERVEEAQRLGFIDLGPLGLEDRMAHHGLEEERVERYHARRGRQTSAPIIEWLIPWLVILGIVVFAVVSFGGAGK